MQKIRITLLYGMIVATAAVLFFCTFLQVNAGTVTSGEASFTHTHKANCYSDVTLSCKEMHTSKSVTFSGTYHCTSCGIMADQWVQYTLWTCPKQGDTWQVNAKISCKTCGTVHSVWSDTLPNVHTYKEKGLTCGMGAGEKTAVLSISADDAWTNSGVTLTANIKQLKQDLIYGSVSSSWEGGKLYVTENGTYTATATDAAGRSVTVSIEIGCIDKIAPVIKNVDADTSGMSRTSIYVNVSAEDNESGLDAQAFSFDGGQTWSSSSGVLLKEGEDIQLAVRDRAGNITTRSLKRSAFPYPPEPSSPPPASSSPAGTTAPSENSASSSGNEPISESSGKASELSEKASELSGKVSESSEDTSESLKKNSQDSTNLAEGKVSSSGRNGVTAKEEDTDPAAEDTSEEDESDTASLSPEGIMGILSEFVTVTQKQEAFRRGLEDNVLKTKAAVSPVKGSVQDGENAARASNGAEKFLSVIASYIYTHLRSLLGTGLLMTGTALLLRLVWLHSAVLYCYNGGEEYRRVGLLHLRRRKQEFELYLPEYLLETRGTPRYRLMLKKKLVKRHEGVDLIVRGEDYKLRQPLEECVDFVL